MTPKEYLDLFRTRWPTIVAGLLLGVAVAATVLVLTPQQYEARVTLFISAGSAEDAAGALDRNELSAQRMQTYVSLATSNRISTEVVEALGLDESGDELADRITASSDPDTVLLDATVSDQDPERAALIANTLAERISAAVAELEQGTEAAPGTAVVSATIFEAAVPPAEPASPRPLQILAIGAVLGLLAGIAVAALRRSLDTSITSRRQLAETVGAPVLGVSGRHRHADLRLAVCDDPRGQEAEAYRRLRSNLQFVDVDHAHKVVMFTGGSPGDGTTTVVSNLACALAEAGQRVLLVEADLRRPRAAEWFGAERIVGLTNVLARRAQLDDVVQQGKAGVDIVTSGPVPPNPAQLLASPRMVQLVTELRARYDVVLVDAAPLLPVADASALAPIVDAVVLVVRSGTPAARVESASEELSAVAARLLGTVLTMTKGRASRVDERYVAASPSAPPVPAVFPEPPPARGAEERTSAVPAAVPAPVPGNGRRSDGQQPTPFPRPARPEGG